MPQNFPKIFVITLPEAKDRQQTITHMFQEHGLEFKFFNAYDGRKLSLEEYPQYNATGRLLTYGKHMTNGEIGCLLSHCGIYQKMIDEDISSALIFEDDVILEKDFKQVITGIAQSNTKTPIIRFLNQGKINKKKKRLVTPLSDKHALYRYKGIPGGAYATFITNEGARKILKPAQHTFYPIDILMGCYWKTCADWLVVSPAIATHNDEVESFIGDARFENNSDLTGILKIIYPFTRGLFKISETILKTLWYYGFYFKDKRMKDTA